MHPYWNNESYAPGDLVVTKESLGVPQKENPTGNGVKAYNDAMEAVGFIPPGTRLILLKRPVGQVRGQGRTSMYIEVIAPEFGRVWVQASNITRV